MPGQFKHLAPRFAADPKNTVVFVTKRTDVDIPGVKRLSYPAPQGAGENTHAYVRLFEACVRQGQAAARSFIQLRSSGFRPDVIVAHPGWGEALYVKDVWPDAPLLNFCEFYYHGRGADVGFDPEEPAGIDQICRARTRNAHLLLSLEACDAGYSPTHWQKNSHPAEMRDKIEVIFDGVDTDTVKPKHNARVELPNGATLSRKDEVVTYVARNLEPYRGYPSFVRSLPKLLAARPDAQVIVVGGDEVSYGRPPPGGGTWREHMLKEVPLDPRRVHFLGKLPYAKYLAVLQISSLHVYLTRPFVLSWSFMEAMAAECLVLGSATPPVEEVLIDRYNGFLTDFFRPEQIAEQAADLLASRDKLDEVRKRARNTVLDRYALKLCLPEQVKLIKRVGGG
jgi:glycosyltransferase involved in cell wall biosynthesis